MIHTIVGALLPIVVTLVLGAFAGWQHDEDQKAATALNTMVLHYALPLALFSGTVATPRSTLLAQGPLALVLLIGMVAPFAALCVTIWRGSAKTPGVTALRAMGLGLPAIPFTGIPILTPLLGGSQAVIVVAVGASVINIVVVPATLLLIEFYGPKHPKKADERREAEADVAAVLRKALLQPIVVAPVLGIVAVLSGIPIPGLLLDAFKLLGSTVGGVSLFASGLVLQGQKPALSWAAVWLTAARNLLIPGAALVGLRLLHVDHGLIKAGVLALALPAGPMQVTLALRYGTDQQVQASYLLFSSVLSVASLALLIVLLG